MEHSWIAPSSMPTVMKCPGSLQAQRNVPDEEESEAAKEGNLAHAVAASELDMAQAPVLEMIPDEMRDGVQVYTHFVRETCGDKAHIEKRVECPTIHPDCFGTTDAYWFDSRGEGTLHVFDFKYGWRLVEAVRNWQMLCYASGLILPYKPAVIKLHIIQPRPWHHEGSIRTWSVSLSDLVSYTEQMNTAVQSAVVINPMCVTGPHCVNCDAFLHCNVAWEAVTNAIDVSGRLSISEMDPVILGIQYSILARAAKMISKRLAKAETMGLHMLGNGQRVPGLSLTNGRGSVSWDGDKEGIISTGDLLGVDLRKPEALKTPNQAVSAGMSKDLVNSMTTKKKGSRKLKIDDMNAISRIFN